MFESIVKDKGQESLTRASRIFFVITALILLGIALSVVFTLIGGGRLRPVVITINLVFAGVAYVTGKGVDEGKPWAKWAGIALGVLELLNFPIGTVVGIAILVYLNRANKAGLFKTPASTQAEIEPK
jgi:hypothetical protein